MIQLQYSIDIMPYIIGFLSNEIGKLWSVNAIVIDKYVSTYWKIIAWSKSVEWLNYCLMLLLPLLLLCNFNYYKHLTKCIWFQAKIAHENSARTLYRCWAHDSCTKLRLEQKQTEREIKRIKEIKMLKTKCWK